MTALDITVEGRTRQTGWPWSPSDPGRGSAPRDQVGGSRRCRPPRELLVSFGIPSSGMDGSGRGSGARESYFELTMKKSIYQYASKSRMEKPR